MAARAERRRCERMGADALAAFRGDTVLYVGEFDGAAATGAELTGGARLHGALRAGWDLARAPLPLGERWRTHWYGFDEAQDFLTIWHRRRGVPPDDENEARAEASVEESSDAAWAAAWTPDVADSMWRQRIMIFELQWCVSTHLRRLLVLSSLRALTARAALSVPAHACDAGASGRSWRASC
jgi:hypothetical protein